MKRSTVISAVIVGAVVVAAATIYWRMQTPPPLSGLTSEQDKDAFIASAKQSCIQREMNDPATRQAGYTQAQVALYCQCAAEKAAEVITPDEVQYIRANHAIPPSFEAKTKAIAQTCRSVTLPPPAQ
ncbi:MAG: hypothetical protein KGJ66_05865 [Alphaproteobacteria bacterium]|nr:hypothetical protein [Alphaproteobacteria bacterium]